MSLAHRLLSSAAGPEAALIARLKNFEHSGMTLSIADLGQLHGIKATFQRISISLSSNVQSATVVSTLDFTGDFTRSGTDLRTQISSLGLERAHYRWADDTWVPHATDAPRLLAILTALEHRRIQLNSRRPAGFQHLSKAWFIRSERNETLVSEDFIEKTAHRSEKNGTRRLALLENASGVFHVFTSRHRMSDNAAAQHFK